MSPRQDQIMALLSLGYKNREIAEDLGISEETVKSHMGEILRKLGARNRTHAVALWMAGR